MGNTRRQKGELRKLAQGAMKRMKNGYWEKARLMREAAKQEAESAGKNADMVDSYFRNKFTSDLVLKVMPVDDSMYLKVCDILDSDEDVSNPIAKLIEKEKYNALDNSGKQRYIMMLSAKYQELSARYHDERAKGIR